jgi:hypothetical protein
LNVEISTVPARNLNEYFEVPLDTNKNYVERYNITNSLEQFLVLGTDNPGPASRRIVLHGLGGSGKTEIVVRFAEQHRKDYTAVFWVDGTDETRMNDGFQVIARALGVDDATEPQQSVSSARSWLINNNKWLLIVDNLDEDSAMDVLQRKYLNAGMNGDILITSRNPKAAARWKSIEVSDMEPQEAKTLLTNIASSLISNDTELDGLLHDLGYLPLAIDQAASFILETGISVAQYRKLFLTERRRLLEHFPSTQYNQESRHSVMTTWELCFSRVEADNLPASKLLLIFSLLHHDQIPFSILESALQGQRHWAPSGEFEEVPEDECWIPKDMLPIFSNQFCLLEAIVALRKFSLVRHQASQQTDSMTLRIHPLVHYWAAQRLERSPALLQQLKICTIGLVSGSFAKQDRLPPLTSRKLSTYTLEERSLGTWPWRQYPQLAPHALRCLQYSKTLKIMPESVAHLSLSLLQILEYSSFGTFKNDQAFALSVIDHIEKFQTARDKYLQYTSIVWRLTRGELCACQKLLGSFLNACSSCSSTVKSAKILLSNVKTTARVRVAVRSIESILNLQRKTPIGSSRSWIERYEEASRRYLDVRAQSEDSFEFRGIEGHALMVASSFKSLCGETSEEFRRGLFYATGPLMQPGKWPEVESMLRPLVDMSIKCPVHSWSHERCIIRLMEALLQQGKDDEAGAILQEVQKAYRTTGKQLRTVEFSKLAKDVSDAVSSLTRCLYPLTFDAIRAHQRKRCRSSSI